jgi:hypothetical protein
MIAAARLVAGAVLSVSDLDLCLSLFISMTQTLFILHSTTFTYLTTITCTCCGCGLHRVFTTLHTNDYLKSSTHSSNVTLTLICFITLRLLIQVSLFDAVCSVCLLHTDTIQSHTCQRHNSREKLALFFILFTTILRSLCALFHANWAIIARLVLDCLRNQTRQQHHSTYSFALFYT